MGLEPWVVIYLDATAIIEAHVLGIWPALAARLPLATSAKCLAEVAAGNRPGGGRVMVDIQRVRREISIHQVPPNAVVEAVLAGGFDISSLDPGEKELLALVRTKEGAWSISSQDLGCIRGRNTLGLLDRFVSLEELAKAAGARPRTPFRPHFTKRWLSEMRTRAILGTL